MNQYTRRAQYIDDPKTIDRYYGDVRSCATCRCRRHAPRTPPFRLSVCPVARRHRAKHGTASSPYHHSGYSSPCATSPSRPAFGHASRGSGSSRRARRPRPLVFTSSCGNGGSCDPGTIVNKSAESVSDASSAVRRRGKPLKPGARILERVRADIGHVCAIDSARPVIGEITALLLAAATKRGAWRCAYGGVNFTCEGLEPDMSGSHDASAAPALRLCLPPYGEKRLAGSASLNLVADHLPLEGLPEDLLALRVCGPSRAAAVTETSRLSTGCGIVRGRAPRRL